jgi:hypothetical protein
MKKWQGDQHLAIKCHSQPKKWIQGNGGSQQKLAATHKRMIHHVGLAQHKGQSHTGLMVKERQQISGPEKMLQRELGKMDIWEETSGKT